MLIGYRYESTAEELRIHSVNRMVPVLILFLLLITCAAPLAFGVDGWISGHSPFARLRLLETLIVTLALLALPALGLAVLLYLPARETLVLSARQGYGLRSQANIFGRHRKRVDEFNLEHARALQLRLIRSSRPSPVQLWLQLRSGDEHRLNFDTVQLKPGTAKTDAWLQQIAAELQLPLPTRVIEFTPEQYQREREKQPRQRKTPRIAAPPRQTTAALNLVSRSSSSSPAPAFGPHHDPDRINAVVRVFLALFGAMMALYELTQLFALVRGVSRGVLRVSGYRSNSSHRYSWSEEPVWFSVHLLMGIGEVLFVGFIAWACMRLAVYGRFGSKP